MYTLILLRLMFMMTIR